MNGIVFYAFLAVTQQASLSGMDPVRHPQGLEFVVFERNRFNNLLGIIPPAVRREANVDEEITVKLRELNTRRYSAQMKKIKEMKPDWLSGDEDTRRKLISDLKKADDKLVDSQLADLEELLLPGQQMALMREFMRTGDPIGLLDPVVAKWLGLSEKERAAMAKHHRESQEFLKRTRLGNVDRTKPLPKDLDQEFRHMRERIWSGLSEDKLVKCFRVLGFIANDEDLSDFLQRYPERSKYLESEVRVFRVVRLRIDSGISGGEKK